MSPREPMPWVMRAFLATLGLQVALDVAAIATASEASALEIAVFAIDLGVIALLVHGSEAARGLVRLAAALGMAFDAWLLAVTLAWSPPGMAGRVAIGTASLLLALSAITFVVLGREDVRRWVFARWLARKGLDTA